MKRFKSIVAVVSTLNDIRSNIGKINKCKELKMQQLHTDDHMQSRAVFAVNKYWVVKIPLNRVGLLQSTQELSLYNMLQSKHKKYFAALHPLSTPDLIIMRGCFQYPDNIIDADEYFHFQKLIKKVFNCYGVKVPDVCPNNMGYFAGGLVMLDYGANRSICSRYTRAWSNKTYKQKWFGLCEV